MCVNTIAARVAGMGQAHAPVRHGGRLEFDPCGRRPLLDFSSSVTPLGMPPAVLRALRGAARLASEYPDPRSSVLLAELSRYVRLPKSHVMVGGGAIDLIYCWALAFGGGKTLIPAPTFQEYEHASRVYHGSSGMAHFETMSLSSDLDRFVKRLPDGGGTVFICNPNNPTGELLSRRQVREVVDAAAAATAPSAAAGPCHVMVDECFIEMSERPDESVVQLVRRYDNLTVLRSMTKSFGMPGVRVGYAAASPGIVEVLHGVKAPWSVSRMAEEAGMAALRDAGTILRKTRDVVRRESAYLQGRLSRVGGVSCYDTSANFMLLRTRLDSARLQGRLARAKGVLVRDCSGFRGLDRHHIRVAVKRRGENSLLAGALEDLLS